MDRSNLNIKSEDVFRLLKYEKRTKNIADKATNNSIVPFPGFDSVEFNETIWKVIKKEKYGQSYTLYIHTLRVCVELLLEYEKTKEKKYYDKAKEIIYSWLNFIKHPTNNKMIWYDHTTANRTQVLIHFLFISQTLEEEIDYSLFYDILIKHGEVLIDDSKHNLNNHGLMMDRSLMILGNILNHDEYKAKGISRAKETFWFSFSHNGVHLENSPQYHNMVLRMYWEIEDYLKVREESLGQAIVEYMKLAERYSSAIVRPNKKIASIGDTGSSFKKIVKTYDSFYDREAGIALLQHENPNPLFLSFICGYSTKVHKHKDDLSITLNYNKKDFLVDPGPFNYSKHKIRKYITSKEAHSGFYLTEFDYSLKDSNRYSRNVSLDNFFETEDYYIVKGFNHDYDGSSAKLSRTIIYFKSTMLVILIDDVMTNVKHKLKFTQNFNLDQNVKVVEDNDSVSLGSNGTYLTIKQFNNIETSYIVEGDKNIPVALNTTGFGKATSTQQIKYKNSTNDKNVFNTAIYDDANIHNLNLKRDENKLSIQFNEDEYSVYL